MLQNIFSHYFVELLILLSDKNKKNLKKMVYTLYKLFVVKLFTELTNLLSSNNH